MSMSTGKLAHVNGISPVYQEYGAGDPLVLLHGGFGTIEMFGPTSRRWPSAAE